MTAAHYQVVTLNTRLREWVPEHEPREHDPNYHIFHATKLLLRKHDIHCWRCDVSYAGLNKRRGEPSTPANPLGAYQLEAHHDDLEFSLLNGVDVEKWWDASHPQGPEAALVEAFSNVDGWLQDHPQFARPNGLQPGEQTLAWHSRVFDAYMESEGNLMQLCDACHRSKDQGIHHIPYPDWRATAKVWKAGQPPHIAAVAMLDEMRAQVQAPGSARS